MLPIPELMPFRLTRQMRGVLQPHDACELLKAPLALGLAALRAGSGILEVIGLLISLSCVNTCIARSFIRCASFGFLTCTNHASFERSRFF